eukprot:c13965_g1_i1.p1 GENE.c13965_g1_i1~~c13965_g1_i1.p1  ORF type:complete len:110 (+),score=22.62 c13965_g1_i1:92-421(+)
MLFDDLCDMLFCLVNASNAKQLELLLLQEPTLVSARNHQGRTALHVAVKEERAELVKVLLMNGANMFATDPYGKTPRHDALDPRIIEIFNNVCINTPNTTKHSKHTLPS